MLGINEEKGSTLNVLPGRPSDGPIACYFLVPSIYVRFSGIDSLDKQHMYLGS